VSSIENPANEETASGRYRRRRTRRSRSWGGARYARNRLRRRRAAARPATPRQGPKSTQRSVEHFYFWGIAEELRAVRMLPPSYPMSGIVAYPTSTTNIGTHRRCAKSSTPITSRRTNGCRLEGACQLSRAARPDLRAPLRRIADLVWTAPLARAAPPARTRSKPAPGIICRRSAYPSKSCGTVTRTAGEPTRLSSSSCARTATSPGPAMNRRVTQPRSSPKPPGAKRSSPRLCAVQAVLIFFRR
jgi:hypothetical protein